MKDTIKTKKEQVYNYIKKQIIDGKLKPGEWIQEKKIAKTLNVSRSPVRESLKELSVEGLTVNVPNKGVYVRKLTVSDIIDIYEIRFLMERYSIQKIIERISKDDQAEEIFIKLNKLKKQFINSFNNNDVHSYAKTDAEFHINLVKMSKNKTAYSMFEKSFQNIKTFQIVPLENKERFEDSFTEHIKTIEAIEEKNFEKSWDWNSRNLKLATKRTLKVVSKIDGEEFNNNDNLELLESCSSRMEKLINR